MNKTISSCLLVCSVATWIILSLSNPYVLSDENTFLKGFVNHEMLAFMGVLVTITLASAANLHLALNKIEEDGNAGTGKDPFARTRKSVRSSGTMLLWLLAGSIAIVVAKPIGLHGVRNLGRESFFNGFALVLLVMAILILIDLTRAIFALGPRKRSSDAQARSHS